MLEQAQQLTTGMNYQIFAFKLSLYIWRLFLYIAKEKFKIQGKKIISETKFSLQGNASNYYCTCP